MKNQNGNTSLIIVVVGLVIVGIAGFFMYSATRPQSSTAEDTVMEGKEETMMSDYSGELISGSNTPYLVFNEADYQKAQEEGKIIVLDFYANWCPVCRAEAPDIEAGFDQLNNDQVVGFRVNYNDTETDEFEKSLAQEHGVTYQHTKVIIKDGEQVLKDGLVWNTEAFLENVNSVL